MQPCWLLAGTNLLAKYILIHRTHDIQTLSSSPQSPAGRVGAPSGDSWGSSQARGHLSIQYMKSRKDREDPEGPRDTIHWLTSHTPFPGKQSLLCILHPMFSHPESHCQVFLAHLSTLHSHMWKLYSSLEAHLKVTSFTKSPFNLTQK
jgi:hypothetical protein